MLHIRLESGQKQPNGLWQVLEQCTPQGPWVCGGAARRLYFEEVLTNDVDVFFANQVQFDETERWIVQEGGVLYHAAKCNDTYTFNGLLVQLVKSYFSSVDDVLRSFDFRMCMFGCNGEQITHEDLAVDDVKNKHLILNKAKLPLYTLARITKYGEQGFSVPPRLANDMLIRLAESAREQLANGGDVGYGDL